MLPVWMMPQGASYKLRSKMWLDFQNDVKVSDVQLAAREGFESVEHTKRYTTLGMATDQGKLSNINGLAVLSGRAERTDPAGRHHHLPPALHADLDGRDRRRGARRDLPAAAPHADARLARGQRRALGAGRPLAPSLLLTSRAAKASNEAVIREVKNTRQAVGLLDASTLGKIIVKGPDAGRIPRHALHQHDEHAEAGADAAMA